MLTKWLTAYMLFFVVVQCFAGNIDTGLFAFPIGFALAVAAIAVLYVLERERGQAKWLVAMRSPKMACALLSLTTAACIAVGSVPSLSPFSTSWPFVALLVALAMHLTLIVIHRLRSFSLKRDGAFMAVHGGLWLALACGLVGAADTSELRTMVTTGHETTRAFDPQGRAVPLPYSLQLRDFSIERNKADGSPTQYAATVAIDGKPTRLAVNSPYQMSMSEDIYLMSFDARGSQANRVSCVLQIVRQPLKYPMLAGIVLLLAGVVFNLKRLI